MLLIQKFVRGFSTHVLMYILSTCILYIYFPATGAPGWMEDACTPEAVAGMEKMQPISPSENSLILSINLKRHLFL
jgi:hypothetical protein